MSNQLTVQNEEEDLQQLRDILFGEQALQTEDRFSSLETAINSLRRENRQLRQALEMEAMARIKADGEQGTGIQNQFSQSFSDVSNILLAHAENEKTKRAIQFDALVKTLDTYRQNQDEVTEQLVSHIRSEQTKRAEQFVQLNATLTTSQGSQNEVADALMELLQKFQTEHQLNDGNSGD